MMDIHAFLESLKEQKSYDGQISHIEHIIRREPISGETEYPLPDQLREILDARGMHPLYRHQAATVNLTREHRDIIVATPSASGKTLCYNVPVACALLEDKTSTALYLFPTKALAHDQYRGLKDLLHPDLLKFSDFANFDGDTPPGERGEIRKHARLVLSNPDMLHLGILPNHRQWSRFLRHLKYVVLDEAHVYRGVFGSHVGGIMRRLIRLCRYYGSEPQFICCSATIANPGELAGKLIGRPCRVIDDDGAPYGGKDFVFWNPPLVDKARGRRRSANSEAANLTAALVADDIRTLTFARSRKLTELIYLYAKNKLEEISPSAKARIKPYRAGYLPAERRKIEQEMAGGQLLGVVATNALELGIDIGSLEATVLTGYPGSIASTWQQAGRSGRRKTRSLSILIGVENPLDQYYMNHPDIFFGQTVENALVNPGNRYIVRAHLICAAWEKPLVAADKQYFGEGFEAEIAELEASGILHQRHYKWYLAAAIAYPAQAVSIRSSSGEKFSLMDADSGALLETIDASTAYFQLHTGAVYLHQGETYLIVESDPASKIARGKLSDANYYTEVRDLTDLTITSTMRQKTAGAVNVYLGEVDVTTTVLGYRKKVQFSEEIIGEEPLDMPPQQFSTVALWFDLPAATLAAITRDGLDAAGGLHGAEHAAIAMLPIFALCDRNDIGGVSTPLHPDTGRAQIFIYDAYPGGIGIAEKGYEIITDLWRETLRAISACPCEDGCPSCIQSPKCGNNNIPLDKAAARRLLIGLLAPGPSD
jgi:DEAD/DEAH box helicase domain-containing protein